MTYKPEKGSRQPVVLYDQDNKAIDVSGIKELSSIKGDLEMVKDNQGRLYGKYGEAWVPVKVNAEGQLELSTIGALDLVDNPNRELGKVQLSGTIAELQTDLLSTIAYNTGMGGIKVSSWSNVQHIVRAGLHHQVFQVGDQFMALFDGNPVVWVVIGIDHDKPSNQLYKHSLTLQLHDCILNCEFDAREALHYTTDGLSAGTYNFTHSGTSYQFTLTESVPPGGQLTFPWVHDTDILTTRVSSFASQSSTTAIETVGISAGADGITITETNDISRCRYGSNNYAESNIREWLNSEANSHVWTPQTIYDRPSTEAPYTGAGFLNLLDPDLVAVLGAVDKQVARNTVTDDDGQDNFSDKVFLLSRVEAGYGSEGTVAGEEVYLFYEGLQNADKIKLLGNSARNWWLRSPDVGESSRVRYVNASGALSSSVAYSSYGAAPACCIV